MLHAPRPGAPGIPVVPGFPGIPVVPGCPGIPCDPGGPAGPSLPYARLVLCKRKELRVQFNCRIFVVFNVDRIMDDPENSSCHVNGKAGLEKLEEKYFLSLSPFVSLRGWGSFTSFFTHRATSRSLHSPRPCAHQPV